MNSFCKRAEKERRLKSLYNVLARELGEMASTKRGELVKFESVSANPVALLEYRKNTGLTKEVCERILSEVRVDIDKCWSLKTSNPENNAIDGEKDLKTLYRESSDVKIVWSATNGQKPVDLIVVSPKDESILLGDCKFGLKSDEPWIVRNEAQFREEFADKFVSVGCVLKSNDGVECRPEMVMVVTSALAPLIKNRIEDYKLDPRYASIPYDRIRVCSVEDVYEVCKGLLVWDD